MIIERRISINFKDMILIIKYYQSGINKRIIKRSKLLNMFELVIIKFSKSHKWLRYLRVNISLCHEANYKMHSSTTINL
jgi:hypothetical protein